MKFRSPLRRLPKLNGFPQLVDFRGVPMRIVQMESGTSERVLCLKCGQVEHRQTVTLTLADEASHTESRIR